MSNLSNSSQDDVDEETSAARARRQERLDQLEAKETMRIQVAHQQYQEHTRNKAEIKRREKENAKLTDRV